MEMTFREFYDFGDSDGPFPTHQVWEYQNGNMSMVTFVNPATKGVRIKWINPYPTNLMLNAISVRCDDGMIEVVITSNRKDAKYCDLQDRGGVEQNVPYLRDQESRILLLKIVEDRLQITSFSVNPRTD